MSKNLAAVANVVAAQTSIKSAAEQLAEMQAENERLKAIVAAQSNKATGRITVKVQDQPKLDKDTNQMKPATFTVSVYGLGRFPVTLHGSQWAALLAPEVVKAIQAACNDPRVVAAGKAHDSK